MTPAKLDLYGRRLAARATRLYARLNVAHFGGLLPPIPVRVNTRFRTVLARVTLDDMTLVASALEVADRDWTDADLRRVLKHEMIHVWQCVTGHKMGHDARFRGKAAELGVLPTPPPTVVAVTYGAKEKV